MTVPSQLSPRAPLEDDDRLAKEITLLAGQINAANYRLLKLIADFDRRKGWSGGGTVRSCAHWLNWKCGIAIGAAREKVRVALCLDELPLIDASFKAGELSYSKVRAMTRVATPENEGALLNIAKYGTASHVEKAVSCYRRVRGALNDTSEKAQANERDLSWYQDDDGMWVIRARLTPEAGALVVKAIEAVAAPVQMEKQKEIQSNAENDEADQKDVSAEIFSDAVEQQDRPSFQDLLTHTRADALVAITEHFLATAGDGTRVQGLKGSERCQVVLHVDIDTLREHGKPPGPVHEHCHLDDRPWLCPSTAKRLSCDASLVTVLEDENGKVLNVGRRSRTVPAAIDRALKHRDKTCRFPGCCETRYIDAHHIQHWVDGGDTSLDNLVTLCRRHHRQLHQGSFAVEMLKDAGDMRLVFTTPNGETIESSLFPQFPKLSAEISDEGLGRLAPWVTPDTCASRWQGECCDYGMVVDGLLCRDRGGSSEGVSGRNV